MWFIVILYGAPMSYCCNTACYSQMLWWRYKSLTTDPFAAADTFYWKWIYEARTVICSWIMDQNGTEYSPFSHFQSPAAKKSKVCILRIVFNQKNKLKSNERFIEGNLLLKVANMSSNYNSNVNNILVVNEIYFLGGKSNNISSCLKNISTCWVIFWGEMYSISSFIGNIFNDNG